MNHLHKDTLAFELYGITYTEALTKHVCVRCKKIPVFQTEADQREYLISALCSSCWDEISGDEE